MSTLIKQAWAHKGWRIEVSYMPDISPTTAVWRIEEPAGFEVVHTERTEVPTSVDYYASEIDSGRWDKK